MAGGVGNRQLECLQGGGIAENKLGSTSVYILPDEAGVIVGSHFTPFVGVHPTFLDHLATPRLSHRLRQSLGVYDHAVKELHLHQSRLSEQLDVQWSARGAVPALNVAKQKRLSARLSISFCKRVIPTWGRAPR